MSRCGMAIKNTLSGHAQIKRVDSYGKKRASKAFSSAGEGKSWGGTVPKEKKKVGRESKEIPELKETMEVESKRNGKKKEAQNGN